MRPGSTAGTSRRLAHGWCGVIAGLYRNSVIVHANTSSGSTQTGDCPRTHRRASSAMPTRRTRSAARRCTSTPSAGSSGASCSFVPVPLHVGADDEGGDYEERQQLAASAIAGAAADPVTASAAGTIRPPGQRGHQHKGRHHRFDRRDVGAQVRPATAPPSAAPYSRPTTVPTSSGIPAAAGWTSSARIRDHEQDVVRPVQPHQQRDAEQRARSSRLARARRL